MSDGPFCFGDSATGYTIAYVFRLTDPKARGRRRAYAFVALAGKDASRAFRACPMVWEAFAAMARGIEEAAQRSQDAQKQKQEEQRQTDKNRNYTPISSFLTQRTVDPDGFPRRAGQVSPRSLAEIVGDEHIFALLHQYFVAILRCLGDRFGGLPFSDQAVYQTTINDPAPTKVHTRLVDGSANPRDCKRSTKCHGTKEVEDAVAKLKLSAPSMTTPVQCGPLSADQPGGPQVMV
jgi:Vesicle coat protein involved in Golgi to plasma membrane transport